MFWCLLDPDGSALINFCENPCFVKYKYLFLKFVYVHIRICSNMPFMCPAIRQCSSNSDILASGAAVGLRC